MNFVENVVSYNVAGLKIEIKSLIIARTTVIDKLTCCCCGWLAAPFQFPFSGGIYSQRCHFFPFLFHSCRTIS